MSAGISGSYTVLSAPTISSVSRAISSGGIVDGRSAASAVAGFVSVLVSSVMAKSSEHSLRLDERPGKAVNLIARIVHGERSTAGRSHPEAGKQRHHAMGAGTHGNADAINDGRHVMRMGALEFERNNRTFILGHSENAQRIDFTQPLVGVTEDLRLMRTDARLADRVDVVDCRAEPDRLHDRRRARLELVWRIAIGDVILKHLADHLAAAVERRHGGEVLVLAIEHTDSGRTIELVAGESVEVAIDLAHVDIEVHGSLGAVEQHRDAARVSDAGDFLRRNHGAQHI